MIEKNKIQLRGIGDFIIFKQGLDVVVKHF